MLYESPFFSRTSTFSRELAEQIDEQRQRQPLRVVDPLRPSTDDAVRLVRMFGNDSGERFDGGGLPAREIPCGTFDVVQVAGDGRFDALGREVPDRRENHLVGGVRAAREGAYRLPVVACERILAPQDVVPQLRPCEEHVLERIVNQVGRRILVGVYLVRDHLLFAFQFPLGEGRAEGYVGDQFGRPGEVAAQRRGVYGRVLLGGEGVEFPAEVFQPAVDLPGTAALRAFEKRMFGQMRQPVLVGMLVAAAGVDDQRTVRHVAFHLAVDAPDAVGESVCEEFHCCCLSGNFRLYRGGVRYNFVRRRRYFPV